MVHQILGWVMLIGQHHGMDGFSIQLAHGQQGAGQSRTQKSAATGDQNLHGFSLSA
jgi:hypothetical protein